MLASLRSLRLQLRFHGSERYWERHYQRGGTSGEGSYGRYADHKASFLNEFVAANNIASVVEFGCGDGNQLALADYPRYLGLDASPTAVETCIRRFKSDTSKSFALYSPRMFNDPASFIRADLAVSLDVIYHLTEDDIFDLYMRHLFAAADRFVVIYARDSEDPDPAPWVRHRRFTPWVEANTRWMLDRVVPRPDPAIQDFFVFRPRY